MPKMNNRRLSWLFLSGLLGAMFGAAPSARAQHAHDAADQRRVTAPTVFLDKSPRVVEYQLKRLSNEQLLLIETARDDKKYAPVFSAILAREGIPASNRKAALEGLVAINKTDPVTELASAIGAIQGTDATATRALRTLSELLLGLPAQQLFDQQAALSQLAKAPSEIVAPVGFAALVTAGAKATALDIAATHGSLPSLLQGVALIPDPRARDDLHPTALSATADDEPEAVRGAAVDALAHISVHQDETFQRVAELLQEESLRERAIRTLLAMAPEARDAPLSRSLVAWLVELAESTPAANRTSDSFVDAMQLVDELMTHVSAEQARVYRQRLRETVVRVVRIRTVEEEMRYDLPYFAVEAGRPVQVVLVNHDLMPHNLVFTLPGALKEVAELGMQVGPGGGRAGKQYVPDSEKVLFATDMVNAEQQEALTFTAPDEPGEYPYVCTFPRHWMRMYGVMVVVEDLDAWLKNPVEPTDPVGSNRSFVQSWSVDDFEDLETGLRGRSLELGKRLFVEASCAQCHRAGELVAGNVGPELEGVMSRWKGSTRDVLQEILDPSHRIDPKYVVEIVVTEDGETVTGLVVDETKESISVLENPEATEPRVIAISEIAGRRQTSNSMMPKGLLDRFSRDEIFEILAYIQSLQPPKKS